jgi:hypothetical protein
MGFGDVSNGKWITFPIYGNWSPFKIEVTGGSNGTGVDTIDNRNGASTSEWGNTGTHVNNLGKTGTNRPIRIGKFYSGTYSGQVVIQLRSGFDWVAGQVILTQNTGTPSSIVYSGTSQPSGSINWMTGE